MAPANPGIFKLLAMARGLSDLQRAILKIISCLPGGSGELTRVFDQIKLNLYAQYYERHLNTEQRYSIKEKRFESIISRSEEVTPRIQQTYRGHFPRFVKYADDKPADITEQEFRQNQLILNKIRVIISMSVRGLVKRGLLIKDKEAQSGKMHLRITQEGRLIINAD